MSHGIVRFYIADIKPANLLINLNGDVKVSDLGILREVDPAVDTNHFVHTYIGTATYMSPERIDALDYSYSSDIWSFGLTMLTLSFGKLPDQVSGGYWTILSNMHDKPSPSLTDDDNPQHNWSEEYIDFISQCLQKDPQLRASAADLLQHPFLNKAFSESFERSEVECEGVSELESILGSLLLHLDARETSALDVFIVLRKPKRSSLRMTADGEARSTNGYLDVTLDVFELSESEMLQCLLFNEYPSNVIEKARALMQEMSEELEHDGTMLHVLNRFVPHASNSEVDEDRDCDCVCCSGKFDVGGDDETTNSSVRLLGLARQLHLPIALTINTARQFVEQAHSQLKLAIL
jgi:serine/threonine protein kinase